MAFLNKKEDYESMGLTPPEHTEHGTLAELEQQRRQDEHQHFWQQRGNDVYCEVGSNKHGRYVPPDHILIGTDTDGTPLYKIVKV